MSFSVPLLLLFTFAFSQIVVHANHLRSGTTNAGGNPGAKPTSFPRVLPTRNPSVTPSIKSTKSPSAPPSSKPTLSPSSLPTKSPTQLPTVFSCPKGTKVAITSAVINAMITAIATHICTEGFGTYNSNTNTNNRGRNPNQNQNFCQGANNAALGAAIGGVLRLSFHDSATYSDTDGSSGPDGCILFDNPDNGGLKPVVYSKANPATLYTLNDLYTVFSTYSSKADFWAVAANVAVMLGGGPDIAQRTGASCTTSSPCVSMKWGRVDAATCPTDTGRLPSSQLAHQHILDVFQTRLGFSNVEIVTLMGAHTVGRARLNESHIGFTNNEIAKSVNKTGLAGRWDPTPHRFDVGYFKSITAIPWKVKTHNTTENGKNLFSPSTFQWSDKTVSLTQLMLNTDMALVWDVSSVTLSAVTTANPNPAPCSTTLGAGTNLFNKCNKLMIFAPYVFSFQASQAAFFGNWTVAWTKMQELGWSNGKKGSLYSITSTACV